MTIDSIKNGYVIDHIPAGKSMTLYRYLNLDEVDCSVALLRNVHSTKLGKKDIIKIDGALDMNWDTLGYLAPDCTVNIIRDGVLVDKRSIDMPEQLINVIKCKNPRCITTCEQELDHVVRLTDREHKVYRCIYCETKAN